MKKFAIVLSFLFILLCKINAQTNAILVSLQVIPPYSPYLSTYIDQPNKVLITLTNITNVEQEILLHGEITGDNGVSVITNPGFKPNQPITIAGGGVLNISLNSEEAKEYFDVTNISLTGITKAQLIQNQALPEGNYSICIKAFDYATGTQQLSIDGAGCSNFPISYIDAPQPMQPVCGNDLTELSPQFVLFSWTPPATAQGVVEYEFSLKEVPNNMNPYDVIKNQIFPVIYSTTQTGSNTLIYSASLPQLDAEKKYVWRVRALNEAVQFKNGGFSDACWFVYKAAQKGIPVVADNIITDGNIPHVGNVTAVNIPQLPTGFIKGKLQWSFRSTEEKETPIGAVAGVIGANQDGQIVVGDITGGIEKTIAAADGTKYSNQNTTNNGTTTYNVFGQGSGTTGSGSGTYFYQGGFGNPILGNVSLTTSPTVFEKTQNKIDAIAGNKKYPLQATQVKVMLYVKDEIAKKSNPVSAWNLGTGGSFGPPDFSPIEIGTATTNANGEFVISYYKDIAMAFYDLYLEIETKDFIFADAQIPISETSAGVYDIGTLSGIAKTFRLQVKSYEYNFDHSKGYYVKGAPIKNVNVKVSHDPSDWSYSYHPNLTYEGTRINDGIYGSPTNAQVAKAKDDYQIPRLFPNHYTGGYLLAEAAKDAYYSLKVGLNINEKNNPEMFSNYLDKEVPVYVYENKMMGRDPAVKGKVLVEGTNAPVKGATVTIAKPEGGGWLGGIIKITTTNDNGEFEILDIPPREKPYQINISSGSINAYSEELNLNKTALVIDKTFYVTGKLITITGTVRDEEKNALKGAVLVWKTGGTPTVTADNGKFVLTNIKGKHWLIAKKTGFKDTEIEVEVKEPTAGGTFSLADLYSLGDVNLSTGATSTVTQNLLGAIYGSPSGNGNTSANNGLQSLLENYNNISNSFSTSTSGSSTWNFSNPLIQQTGGVNGWLSNLTAPYDVGDIILKRFYLKLKVTDEVTGNTIGNARVEFNGEVVGKTNNSGFIVLSNVAANTDQGLVVYGPDSSLYIPTANNIALDAAKDTTEMTVALKKGIMVKGKVTATGAAAKDATVYVEGTEYIKGKTDINGNYQLAVPAGNKTLWAVKSGFVGDKKTQEFSSGEYTVDFVLKDAGFNAAKLLGFDILLTESKDLGGNEFEITGSFVNIPSNALFKATPGLKIPFSSQKIKKVTGGITPSLGEIQTDVSQLPLCLWDYIKLKLQQSSGLKVKPQGTDLTKGKIEGEMVVDINGTFNGLSGIDIPEMKLQQGTGVNIPAFTSDASVPFSDTKLKLASGISKWTVYDLTLNADLNNTFISKEGLDIAGNISCEGFKYLAGLKMKIEQMRITTTGDIKNLKVSVSPMPKVNLNAWELNMDHIDIGSSGLKLGGKLKVGFSGSNLNIGFANLNVSKTSISGGSFSLAGSGIDLFGLLKVGPGASSGLTLSVLPNGKDFNLSGNVNFNFNKYLSKAVKVDEFGIATNGNLSAKITSPVNVEVFGFAGLNIKTLGINTAEKKVDLGGKIKFNIPGFGAGVGTTMHYTPGSVSFDDFDINMSLGGVGSFAAKATFNLAEEKFAGNGHVQIASSPLDFTAGFIYNKGSFGANFNMGPAVIVPIGPLSLDKIGGGFLYDKPAAKFNVYGECRVKFAPDPSGAVELNPTKFGITVSGGGPVFSATAVGKVLKIPLANASFIMDIPGRKATLNGTAGGSFNLIPGLNTGGNFVVDAELGFGNDPYIFLGQALDINVPFLCSNSGGVATGVNYYINADKAATYHLQEGVNFTGISAWSTASIGIPKSSAKGFDAGVGNVKFWFGNYSNVSFYANLNGFGAGFNLSGGWDAGAEGCLRWVGCTGIAAGASGSLSGGMASDGIQSASANLSAYAKADFGCCGSSCGNKVCWGCWGACPCGVKVCIQKTVGVNYTKGSGFSFDFF